ncbi:MAG: DUF2589 domain-containing protein [Mucilaginibacter polytrichastri]|nr:DUF2589 domain-containing protein [Mucilaginibacter polytrichastri]
MAANLASTIALPYAELIGSPLVAMIEAEALAARASADFIRTVGFSADGENESDFGRMNTVSFSYTKQDVNGKTVTDEISVPILSLIPIPLLQIKEASLEFNLKLTDVTKTETKGKAAGDTPVRLAPAIRMKGVYGGIKNSNSETTSTVDLKVKLNIVQSDIPAGLQKLFQIMESAVQGKNTSEEPPVEKRLVRKTAIKK